MYKSNVKRLATSIALLFAMSIATAPQSAQAITPNPATPATPRCPTLDANRTIIDLNGTGLYRAPSNYQGWSVNWSGCDLSNTKLDSRFFTENFETRFFDSNFSGANFSGAQIRTPLFFDGGSFDDVNFANAKFADDRPSNGWEPGAVTISGPASARRINWKNSVGATVQLVHSFQTEKSDFSYGDFSGANLIGVNSQNVDISNSRFTDTKFAQQFQMYGVVADGIDLSNQDLSGSGLASVALNFESIKSANLENSNLSDRRVIVGEGYTKIYDENYGVSVQFTQNPWAGSNFRNASLKGAQFTFDSYNAASFAGADFTNADFSRATISSKISGNANFTGANFTGTTFKDVDFSEANLNDVKSSQLTIRNVRLPAEWRFINGYMVGPKADLSFASLYNKNLSGMDLSGARLNYADLSESNLTGTNLTNAKMNYANFTSANLSDARLVSSQLDYANLHLSTLTGSNMTGSSMFGANMTNAIVGSPTGIPTRSLVSHAREIRFISPSRTNLSNANFANANLAGSNFNSTNLYKTNFYRANLNDTTFVSAIWNQTTCVDGSLSGAHLVNSCMAAFAIPGTDYNVTYEYNSANGGNSISYSSFKTRGTAISLPSPTRTGYTFAGWYSDSGLKKKIGNAGAKFSPTGRIVALNAFAKWSPNKYVVAYNSKGGSSVTAGSYLYGGQVMAPRPPTRTGYTFAGWSSTDGGAVLTFPYAPGATSNITMFAKWSQNLRADAAIKPTISGTLALGQVLTADKGTWTGNPTPTFSYQWYSCSSPVVSVSKSIPSTCKSISSAKATRLSITNSYKGRYLAVAVTGKSTGTTPTVWLSKSTAKVS